MSSDFSEIQTDSVRVYRVFVKFYQAIVYDFFEKFKKKLENKELGL